MWCAESRRSAEARPAIRRWWSAYGRRGDYPVSLLSGHLGGANRLASESPRITGGRAVVTTA
ncbi:MAG: hypothetical protein V8T87_12910 [Victivallales bacterium]